MENKLFILHTIFSFFICKVAAADGKGNLVLVTFIIVCGIVLCLFMVAVILHILLKFKKLQFSQNNDNARIEIEAIDFFELYRKECLNKISQEEVAATTSTTDANANHSNFNNNNDSGSNRAVMSYTSIETQPPPLPIPSTRHIKPDPIYGNDQDDFDNFEIYQNQNFINHQLFEIPKLRTVSSHPIPNTPPTPSAPPALKIAIPNKTQDRILKPTPSPRTVYPKNYNDLKTEFHDTGDNGAKVPSSTSTLVSDVSYSTDHQGEDEDEIYENLQSYR